MPIIGTADRKSAKGRAAVVGIYAMLIIGGCTMVYPFMVMVSGSLSNPFDFERRSSLPRFLWSRPDRLMRTVCSYFPPSHRGSLRQLRSFLPDVPADWKIWSQVGDDRRGSDAWARRQLARLADPAQRACLEASARDYVEFSRDWDLRETILAYDERYVAPFLRAKYKTLPALNTAWEISIDDFSKVRAAEWSGEPIDQPSYVPYVDTRYRDLLEFRQAYRENRFSRYLRRDDAPAAFLRPAAMAFVWEDYAGDALGESDYQALHCLPFPVPDAAAAELRELWLRFLATAFPVRHVEIRTSARRQEEYRNFLIERFRNLEYLNRLMAHEYRDWEPVGEWDDLRLTSAIPDGAMAEVWMDFVKTSVPVAEWRVRRTLPEKAFQDFALQRYGGLAGVNAAYGRNLEVIEQLRLPFGEALLVTFENCELAITLDQLTTNYRTVFDYLIHRGRAVGNTVVLVALTILLTLTVNPLAGYALSRFRLRQTEKVIVFCLATTAFPAAVASIPGFLLLRDLGLLNTFAALVLPGAVNGMTIFLLKGFFDSLPIELYEAATIDGASEWQVFFTVSLPLVKPILAVSALSAFILAYNGWAWAIIVCQDPKMWTVAVWTYQFYQTLGGQPYIVMAAFIVNSVPVLIVFLFCQKIILRGIILPQMK